MLSVLTLLCAAAAGWVAYAARADFSFRGCNEIPAAEWRFTANCTDGWHVSWMMAAISVGLVIVALLVARVGRRSHA